MSKEIINLKIVTLNIWDWSTEPAFVQILSIVGNNFTLDEYHDFYWPLDYVPSYRKKKPLIPDAHIERELSNAQIKIISSAFQPFLEDQFNENNYYGSGVWKLYITDNNNDEYEFGGSYNSHPFVNNDINPSEVIRECLNVNQILALCGDYNNSLLAQER